MRTMIAMFVLSVAVFPDAGRTDDTMTFGDEYLPSVELGRMQRVDLEVTGIGGHPCVSDPEPIERIVKNTLRDLKIEPSPPLRPNEELATAYPEFDGAPKLTVGATLRLVDSRCEWIFRVEVKGRLEGASGTIVGGRYAGGGAIRGDGYFRKDAPIILWSYEHPGYTESGDFTPQLVPLATEAMRQLREIIELSRSMPKPE